MKEYIKNLRILIGIYVHEKYYLQLSFLIIGCKTEANYQILCIIPPHLYFVQRGNRVPMHTYTYDNPSSIRHAFTKHPLYVWHCAEDLADGVRIETGDSSGTVYINRSHRGVTVQSEP